MGKPFGLPIFFVILQIESVNCTHGISYWEKD